MKEQFLDSSPTWIKYPKDKYSGQSRKKCFYLSETIVRKRAQRSGKKIRKTAGSANKLCFNKTTKDSVKECFYITGRYRGAAHNACNLKMRIKPKTDQTLVVFHNLRGYDADHLKRCDACDVAAAEIGEMYRQQHGEIGRFRFIDSLNFPQENLDSLATISKGSQLL